MPLRLLAMLLLRRVTVFKLTTSVGRRKVQWSGD